VLIVVLELFPNVLNSLQLLPPQQGKTIDLFFKFVNAKSMASPWHACCLRVST